MDEKHVTVTLVGIRNIATGPDPGDSLEIYGDLATKRLFHNEWGDLQAAEQYNLFGRKSGQQINVSHNSIHLINKAADTMTFRPGDWLEVSGHLSEHDTFGSNDFMGGRLERRKFEDIKSEMIDMSFEEDGQKALAKVSVVVS